MSEHVVNELGPDDWHVFRGDHGELLRLEGDGRIYVKGRLAETDKEVVAAFRAWLDHAARIREMDTEGLHLECMRLRTELLAERAIVAALKLAAKGTGR